MANQKFLIGCMLLSGVFVFGCNDLDSNSPNTSMEAANFSEPGLDQSDDHSLVVCNQAWERFLAANPLHHFEKTGETVEQSNDGRVYTQTSKAIHERTVTESNGVQVTVLTKSEITYPAALPVTEKLETTTKADFIDRCLLTGDTAQHPIIKVRVIATGNETITVPSGTFACEYKKISMPDLESHSTELMISTWQTTINGVTMTVRSITDAIIATEGVLSYQRKTIQLIDWH